MGCKQGQAFRSLFGIELFAENAVFLCWMATSVLVAAQLIVLPSRRELYSSYLADRLSRGLTQADLRRQQQSLAEGKRPHAAELLEEHLPLGKAEQVHPCPGTSAAPSS